MPNERETVPEFDRAELPTQPELPSYKCPECRGARIPCDVCKGERLVNRHQLAVWNATRNGRPPA